MRQSVPPTHLVKLLVRSAATRWGGRDAGRTVTNEPLRPLRRCAASAAKVLPVPVSPRRSRLSPVRAAVSSRRANSSMAGVWPTTKPRSRPSFSAVRRWVSRTRVSLAAKSLSQPGWLKSGLTRLASGFESNASFGMVVSPGRVEKIATARPGKRFTKSLYRRPPVVLLAFTASSGKCRSSRTRSGLNVSMRRSASAALSTWSNTKPRGPRCCSIKGLQRTSSMIRIFVIGLSGQSVRRWCAFGRRAPLPPH